MTCVIVVGDGDGKVVGEMNANLPTWSLITTITTEHLGQQ